MNLDILDIRQLDASDLAPLLEAEARAWLQNLRWDFTPSSRLITACLKEGRLSGFVLTEEGRPRGYCFFFIEANKGLIGDLFVLPDYASPRYVEPLLGRALDTLVGAGVSRVEAQLPHFPMEQLADSFRPRSFEVYLRQFMALELPAPSLDGLRRPNPAILETPGIVPSGEFQLEPWKRKHDSQATQLVYETYRHHIDSRLNDQYDSPDGTARLVDNIVHMQSCGEFLLPASRIAIHVATQRLAGILAITRVRARTAHIPQIAVRAEFQGIGLGTAMLESAFAELVRSGFAEVSLTVTALNSGAVRLYERLGFRTFRAFGAFVWQRAVSH